MLACLADLPPASACGQATRPVRAARQRIGCRHVNTGAVAVPSMSYETALYREDTFVCMNRMRLSILLSHKIPDTRARF